MILSHGVYIEQLTAFHCTEWMTLNSVDTELTSTWNTWLLKSWKWFEVRWWIMRKLPWRLNGSSVLVFWLENVSGFRMLCWDRICLQWYLRRCVHTKSQISRMLKFEAVQIEVFMKWWLWGIVVFSKPEVGGATTEHVVKWRRQIYRAHFLWKWMHNQILHALRQISTDTSCLMYIF